MTSLRVRFSLGFVLAILVAAAPLAGAATHPRTRSQDRSPLVTFDPPEVAVGERLFIETRFAQFFAAASPQDVNAHLEAGDPVMATTENTAGILMSGPFSQESMNCRACHLVDEQQAVGGGGIRTYNDFTRRSPVPDRGDGRTHTARNSPPLVNASLLRPGGVLLHFDGEFPSDVSLVKGTLTGRNFGWLAGERAQAVVHIARVIREDNGEGLLALDFGGHPYRRLLAGTDPAIEERLLIPPPYRIDVMRATDGQILDAVARLISAYVRFLQFERDEEGNFTQSPFDRFLVENHIPLSPRRNESDARFTNRVIRMMNRLTEPQFVDEGRFVFHDQERAFGPLELLGLKIFFTRAPKGRALTPSERAAGGIGNCVACHPAPVFTDFGFHNTGVTQSEYDAVHGEGAFAALDIPDLSERNLHPNDFLPLTALHPRARERFRSPAAADRPGFTDLGVWNVFANPDFPAPQAKLRAALCDEVPANVAHRTPSRAAAGGRCSQSALLARAVAAFKTPGLRDLSHAGPYMHDGRFDTLAEVLELYRVNSDLARAGDLRNAAPDLKGIALTGSDADAVVAFLKALNEDYN